LVVHPRLKIFVTVGTDKFLRVYRYDRVSDDEKRQGCLINTIELSSPSRSCDFSPDGKHFVVGYDKGSFEVFQAYYNDATFL